MLGSFDVLKDLERLLQGKLNQEAWSFVIPSRYNKEIILVWLKLTIDQLATIHTKIAKEHHVLIHISDKAECFFRHPQLVVERRGDDLVGIVFVRKRMVAAMLERLLVRHRDFADKIRPAVFVGESDSVSYEKELSELVVPRTRLNSSSQDSWAFHSFTPSSGMIGISSRNIGCRHQRRQS